MQHAIEVEEDNHAERSSVEYLTLPPATPEKMPSRRCVSLKRPWRQPSFMTGRCRAREQSPGVIRRPLPASATRLTDCMARPAKVERPLPTLPLHCSGWRRKADQWLWVVNGPWPSRPPADTRSRRGDLCARRSISTRQGSAPHWCGLPKVLVPILAGQCRLYRGPASRCRP